MICRSISESYIISYTWLFIVVCICSIFAKNKKINKKSLFLFIILFYLLIISSKNDYKQRLKNKKDENYWKLVHYIISVLVLIFIISSVLILKTKYSDIMVIILGCFFIQ